MESPSLEMCEKCVDMALEEIWFSGEQGGGAGLMVGLDLRSLFQP